MTKLENLALLAPSLLLASSIVALGTAVDPEVDGSFLKPYENRWKITVTLANGETRSAGTWTDRLEVSSLEGRPTLKRTQVETESLADETMFPGLKEQLGVETLEATYINQFEPRTLAPLETVYQDNAGRRARFRFSENTVEYEKLGASPDGKAVIGEDRLDGPVFDFGGGMFGMILLGYPLREGLSARFPSFQKGPGRNHGRRESIEFHVTGKETIEAGPLGKRSAWVAEIRDANAYFRFWLSKDPPYILRLVDTKSRPGQTWTFEIF